MKQLNKIKKIIKQHKPEIEKRFHVKEIGIFGSYVRNEQKKRSDVDILVNFESEHLNFDNYMDLKFFLEEQFSKSVDLVLKNSIRPELKKIILNEAIYV